MDILNEVWIRYRWLDMYFLFIRVYLDLIYMYIYVYDNIKRGLFHKYRLDGDISSRFYLIIRHT